jgi:hypothetical protein
MPSASALEAVAFDALLEAVSALGSGRWETLLGLIDRLEGLQGDGRRIIELMSALGHVDIARDPRWLRPTAWSVSPPVMVVGGRGIFLSGWRSEGFIHALGRLAHRLGGRVRQISQPMAPSRVSIEGLDEPALAQLALEASAESGREIQVVHYPGPRLTGVLPSLGEIREALAIIEHRWMPKTEVMDPRTGYWSARDGRMTPGSYRLQTPAGRLYWHFDGVDSRQVDWTLSRWLGRTEGRPPLSWSAETATLNCQRGTPLPPLFERAAVLCSGNVPQQDGTGLQYPAVEQETASRLVSLLSRLTDRAAVGVD